jgi:hypothetical protein
MHDLVTGSFCATMISIECCLRRKNQVVFDMCLSLIFFLDENERERQRKNARAMSRFELKISKKNGKLMLGIYVLQSCLLDVYIGKRIANNWWLQEKERVRESANVIDKKKRIIIIIIVFIFFSEVRILYSPLIIVIQCSIFFSPRKSH